MGLRAYCDRKDDKESQTRENGADVALSRCRLRPHSMMVARLRYQDPTKSSTVL